MAFNIKKLSGIIGGSGKAPGLYTYTTSDNIAALTSNGYWQGMGGILEIGDIILTVALNDTSPTLRSLVVNLSNTIDNKTALLTAYVGDTRATDEAGYLSDNFSGNIGAGSRSRLFSYRNNTDLMATILAVGYFNELAAVLEPGDLVVVVANDSSNYARVISSIDGIVTTEAIALA